MQVISQKVLRWSKQPANEALSFVPDKVELDASGEAVNVTITTNTDSWTYNVDKTWCNVSRNGDVLSVSADEYTDGEPRSAVITVKAGSLSKDITVTQSNTVWHMLLMYLLIFRPATYRK